MARLPKEGNPTADDIREITKAVQQSLITKVSEHGTEIIRIAIAAGYDFGTTGDEEKLTTSHRVAALKVTKLYTEVIADVMESVVRTAYLFMADEEMREEIQNNLQASVNEWIVEALNSIQEQERG